MKIWNLRLVITAMVLANPLMGEIGFASSEDHKKTCQEILSKPGPVFLNSDAIPKADIADLKKDSEIITEIAHKLGLATPPHQMNVVPSDQLNILAVSGGHAAPHFTDGANLIKSLAQSMGVLEFVTPGCPTCRGYYSASTPYLEQLSVVMHVMGHNDMAVNSLYASIRPSDSPWASLHLAERLNEAYRNEGHDQVSLYFQFLKSLNHLQDYSYGTYEFPEKFDPKNMQKIPVSQTGSLFDSLNVVKPATKPDGQSSWNKTASILQFAVNNLPENAPGWQRDLIELYEQTQRVYPAIFNNKIMNEGWATLMQYIIARHSPWNTSKHNVTFAQLLSGVAYPSFENPYWLGLSGWNNLYEEFRERPEVKTLPEFEKDRQFIGWARKMYAGKNDSEWAKVALNERWVHKLKLFLYRKTEWEEMDQDKPPEKQEYIALSRDWKRVRNFVIRSYIDVKYLFRPSISVRNPSHSQRIGVIELEQDLSSGFPLEVTSASKTLFVLSQVLRKPISIKAYFNLPVLPSASDLGNAGPFLPTGPHGGFAPPPWRQKPTELREKLLVYLTVEPGGLVTLRGVDDATHQRLALPEKLAEGLQAHIQHYKSDVLRSFQEDMFIFRQKNWNKLATQVSDQSMDNMADIIYYAPSTNAAIREYLDLIERRLRSSLEDAIQGKAPIQFRKNSVGINVMPEIPEFRYDSRYINLTIMKKPVGPVDGRDSYQASFDIDDHGTSVAPGNLLPGDKFGKKKNNQGDGDGEGDGQGEDGEEGEEEGQTQKPGKGQGQGSGGGQTPTDLNIPLELYGDLLTEMLELPNIRRTEGNEKDFNHVRRGSARRTSGNILWDNTLMMAVEKARALRKAAGRPYDTTVSMMELIPEALKLIEPTDYVVSDQTPEPIPDFDAVLVVSVDMTGSMGGDRITNAKNLLYNLKALLKAKYKNVVIRYVGFSDHAVEMNEKDIFSKFFGGGTAYAPAIAKSREILNEYPRSRYNKYILTIGDGETSDGEAFAQEINNLKEDLQYAGFAATNTPQGAAAVITPLQQLKNEWPWMGITSINQSNEIFRALKDLFPKGGKFEND